MTTPPKGGGSYSTRSFDRDLEIGRTWVDVVPSAWPASSRARLQVELRRGQLTGMLIIDGHATGHFTNGFSITREGYARERIDRPAPR